MTVCWAPLLCPISTTTTTRLIAVMSRLRREPMSRTRPGWFGSKVGRFAIARISPVFGRITIAEALCGRLSALMGPSGVGKSSLLNEVQPGLGLRVAAISEAVNKGRHTTVTAQLIPLECGGWVADTPGLRELGLWEVQRDQLQFYFPEFEPFLGGCRYPTCTHTHEPGCAVHTAAESGEIDFGRYDSYRRMFLGEDEE